MLAGPTLLEGCFFIHGLEIVALSGFGLAVATCSKEQLKNSFLDLTSGPPRAWLGFAPESKLFFNGGTKLLC